MPPIGEPELAVFMRALERVQNRDNQHVEEPHLVVHSDDVHWLIGSTHNPSHIGILQSPMKTVELFLQLIPANTATDLQRHAHESTHYVIDGSGWSEIGDRTVRWGKGDFVYTPPWIWHRHYAGTGDVQMMIIENSRLLNAVDANIRESRGSVSFADEFGANPTDRRAGE